MIAQPPGDPPEERLQWELDSRDELAIASVFWPITVHEHPQCVAKL